MLTLPGPVMPFAPLPSWKKCRLSFQNMYIFLFLQQALPDSDGQVITLFFGTATNPSLCF